jgi:hypothetical protein
VTERANALLMDEEMANYFQYNLGVSPLGLVTAVNYMRSVLGLLSRYN